MPHAGPAGWQIHYVVIKREQRGVYIGIDQTVDITHYCAQKIKFLMMTFLMIFIYLCIQLLKDTSLLIYL
jgi:hypothetical protein